MDGQILGQLRALVEEEEEDGAWAVPSSRPAFPEMGSEELRLASFCDWPPTTTVRPELLAAAGFFHTGESWDGCALGSTSYEEPMPHCRKGPGLRKGGRGPAALHTCPQP